MTDAPPPRAPEVDLDDLAAALERGVPLIDVRRQDEYVEKHVPGAVLVPLDELGARLDEIPRDQQVYVICAAGGRSLTAASALNEHGFDTVSVAGGTNLWASQGRPVVTGDEPA